MTWERKILRKIYGPKCENGVWQIITNLELQNIYIRTPIYQILKLEDWSDWAMWFEWRILDYQRRF
jgi:hypothetical protein